MLDIVKPMELKGVKAKDLALLLESGKLPYIGLVECRSTDSDRYEDIIFNICVEVGQHPIHWELGCLQNLIF